MVETVEPFKLHTTSMWYILKVFKHLQLIWMGLWLHTCTVTITDIFLNLGELAEILDDVNVLTMSLRYGWGCRTFQTASHIHVIHKGCFYVLNSCGWAYGCTLTPLPPQTCSRIWESWLKSYRWCMCGDHVTCYGWGRRTFQTVPHIHVIHIEGILSTFNWYVGLYGSTRTRYHHRCIPQFGRIIAEILGDM